MCTGKAGLAVRVDGGRSTHVLAVHGRLAGRHVRHHHPVSHAVRRPRADLHQELTGGDVGDDVTRAPARACVRACVILTSVALLRTRNQRLMRRLADNAVKSPNSEMSKSG